MTSNQLPKWFKFKRYPHIGLPITKKDVKSKIFYITQPEKIAIHSFFPFIHEQIISRKYRKEYDDNGNIKHNGRRVKGSRKIRDIYYANHLDANIFSYYSSILSKKYEEILERENLTEVVTAYRSCYKKCNIDYAADVFNYIRIKTAEHTISVMAFDIEGFFDNLDHKKLKDSWSYMLSQTENQLPKDHYNVFKNITKFSYVNKQELFDLFQNEIFVETKSGKQKTKRIAKIQYLYEQNAIAFCKSDSIHAIRDNGLIHANKLNNDGTPRTKGICQGSPISAILANIYMLKFDKFIFDLVKKCNGIYRRYSDDMVIVCPIEHKDKIKKELEEAIVSLAKLKIQDKKTQIFRFKKIKNNKLICLQEFNGQINSNSQNRKFEYLGFSFDGNFIYLKSAALSKFYQKMKKGVKRSIFYSRTINNSTNGVIFHQQLYKRYSHLGAKRRLIFKRKEGSRNIYKKTKKYDWGNFITYTNKANEVFTKKMQMHHKIRKQIRNHWKILTEQINKSS